MGFHRAGEVHLCFLDQQATHLGEVASGRAADLIRLSMKGEIHQRVVAEHSAHLYTTGGVCSKSPAQYLDVVTLRELFSGAGDLRALRVGVGESADAPVETYVQIGVI